MTKNQFYQGIERMFDNLEKLSVMYWDYKRELETFDFILDLSLDSKHLSRKSYDKVKKAIVQELKRYE